MSGVDKPLLDIDFAGQCQPMVDHVIATLPQASALVISANRNLSEYRQRAAVTTDSETGLRAEGPLVGIYAGLKWAQTPWLLVCPGDMPALPLNWHDVLRQKDLGQEGLVKNGLGQDEPVREPSNQNESINPAPRVLHDGQRIQPLLSLLPKSALASLSDHLTASKEPARLSVKNWLAAAGAKSMAAPQAVSPFSYGNINAPGDWRGLT